MPIDIIGRFAELPISSVAEEICASLEKTPRLVVTAPPGAGKSTLIPLALLESITEGKILMLEPRRLAARQVALRMASMMDERLGETVGYRVRFDTRISSRTRIEVITEGIMERMLIEDPTLDGVAAVIFDEFHERNLSSDLSLALVREIQTLVRPDLRILVMSATIDASSLARTLDAPHTDSPGRTHDLRIVYGDDFDVRDCALEVARAVNKALHAHEGNILAFLPGQGEIIKCQELLGNNVEEAEDVEILPLYGMLSQEKQQKVMAFPSDGRRRIVLATPIAETSLTIEGITVVVDSGLYRTPVFEPSTGLSRLATERISLDMANQRSGRAGRLAPGVCYRLWSKAAESRMRECRQPEILTSELTSLVLTVSSWGEADVIRLPWVTPPPKGHLNNARSLLRLLDCLDESGRMTPKGKKISELPCHPRIASMLFGAGSLAGMACDIAAILEEKDPCHDESDADISSRIAMLDHYRRGKQSGAFKRIDDISSQYRRLVKAIENPSEWKSADIGRLLAKAYPERIAMRDENGKYKLASGGEAVGLHPADDLARHEFLVIASMGKSIYLAAPLERTDVEDMAIWSQTVNWNSREGRAVAQEELRLGMLVLATRPAKGNVRERITSAIAAAAPKEGLSMFDFNDDVRNLQLRISVASEWHPEAAFPDVSTEKMLATAEEWLPMYIGKALTAQELRKIDMTAVILGLLDYGQQAVLDRITPTQIKLPCGRTARIHYRRGAEAPIVSARIQDCFGLTKTPRVDEGKRPVLMELLSPGFKPVQLTQDLEGFWKDTYFEVRKELRRRYPKHKWPDDPLM